MEGDICGYGADGEEMCASGVRRARHRRQEVEVDRMSHQRAGDGGSGKRKV
jgi:hypothetical protein